MAVYKLTRKYVALIEKHLEQINPKVGIAWRTDELYVKIKGFMKHLYALMDDETRYKEYYR